MKHALHILLFLGGLLLTAFSSRAQTIDAVFFYPNNDSVCVGDSMQFYVQVMATGYNTNDPVKCRISWYNGTQDSTYLLLNCSGPGCTTFGAFYQPYPIPFFGPAGSVIIDDMNGHINGDACDTVRSYNCLPGAGLDDAGNAALLTIYPNPASDWLHIQLPDGWQTKQLTLTAIDGRCVYRQHTGPFTLVPLNSFTPGIYTLTLTEENGQCIQKKLVIR